MQVSGDRNFKREVGQSELRERSAEFSEAQLCVWACGCVKGIFSGTVAYHSPNRIMFGSF